MNERMRDWNIQMALRELEHDVGVGSQDLGPLGFNGIYAVSGPGHASPEIAEARLALARLVELMRRKKGLTVEQLADACDVEVSEVIGIEGELFEGIGPRVIYKLSEFFKVSSSKLMQLSGLKETRDSGLIAQGVRFAARSNSVASLTPEERAALEEFVSKLGED